METEDVTQEELKRMLDYNPDVGIFTWKVPHNRRQPGDAAAVTRGGYRQISIYGKIYPVSKLAWLYVHGEYPDHNLIAENGDGLDCRITNLRPALGRLSRDQRIEFKSEAAARKLNELVAYDPHTGVLTWCQSGSGRTMGAPAGAISNGYRVIWLEGSPYQASNVAWLLSYGEFPSGKITFKNGDGLDCRIDNLRLALSSTEHSRKWAVENPERIRELNRQSNLRQYQGMDVEEYQRLLVEQNGCCAVCQKPETAMRAGTARQLCVDHDHATGATRGLLCNKCNRGLGIIGDENIEAAAAYVRRHASTTTNVVPLKKA